MRSVGVKNKNMQFKEINDLALKIRAKYKEYEIKRNGKPWNNEQIMQGFIVDAGDLMKIVMAKENVRDLWDHYQLDEKLAHELSDCLWSLLVLANIYNINLEKKFVENMKKLEEKIEKNIND
jgi:hypothetical protein